MDNNFRNERRPLDCYNKIIKGMLEFIILNVQQCNLQQKAEKIMWQDLSNLFTYLCDNCMGSITKSEEMIQQRISQ